MPYSVLIDIVGFRSCIKICDNLTKTKLQIMLMAICFRSCIKICDNLTVILLVDLFEYY